ncbi:MAG: hypothetical protein F6K19_28175 [Cyanothece sp. SIO1E1]|nr:hypothetical protein [Cyanothece sp. SIO1E1]
MEHYHFTGTPPRSRFSARTAFRHALTAVGTQQTVQAIFRRGAWVKTRYANASNRAQNGCARQVRACERFFDARTAAGQTGITYNLGAPTGCAASIAPDTSLEATTRGECSSVLGAECDRVAQLESQRLLRHEQFHFNIACELAKKGTLAILRGENPQRTLRTVRRLAARQTTVYDNQTRHGCNATAQATWEADIQAWLPGISIP